MRSYSRVPALLTGLAVCASLAAAPALAQTPVDIRLSMKTAAAPPGEHFRTPFYVETPPNIKLRSLTAQIAYPKGVVSFSKFEKGVLLQGGAFSVETSTAPGAKNDVENLKITIKADPDDAQAALPKGLQVYLEFMVAEKAEAGTIVLLPEVLAAEAVDGAELPKARWAADKQVVTIVSADMKSILACMFYMH
jgi:hypothetical protein